MTRIKICGLSEAEHIRAAGEAGTDFIGLMFAPSQRQVTAEQALELAQAARDMKNKPATVGVFVNETAEEVNRLADFCSLDWVQLSGDESWQYCRDIERPIIKAIHIAEDDMAEDVISEIRDGAHESLQKGSICFLDTGAKDAYGGTGHVFDWQLAGEVSDKYPVIIAGGLTPENVGSLVRLVRPWGVDVSSGVETDGLKDVLKIRAFIESVRKAEGAVAREQGIFLKGYMLG